MNISEFTLFVAFLTLCAAVGLLTWAFDWRVGLGVFAIGVAVILYLEIKL